MSPRRSLGALLTGCLGGLALLAFAPLARADSSLTVTPQTEGWYQSNPSCHAPSRCLTTAGAPATSPYPVRSLHVGFSAGQETARSYLALVLPARTAELRSGSLTVPLDLKQVDGSQSPDRATLQVCLTAATLTAVDGSLASPPEVDCTRSATVVYVPTPTPHLQADLAPLLSRLPSAPGLVLLPDPVKASQSDAWQVVFSAHDRTDAARTAPATVTLTAAELPRARPNPLPGRAADAPLPAGAPTGQQPAGLTPLWGPPAAEPLTAGPGLEPTVLPPPTATTTTTAVLTRAQLITIGYAYPVVWLLPLALLVLVPVTFRALTRDLTGRDLTDTA